MIQRCKCKHDFRAANEMRMKKAKKEMYFFVILLLIIIIISEKTINVNCSATCARYRLD